MRKYNKKIIFILIVTMLVTLLVGCNKEDIKSEDVNVTLRLQWQIQSQFAGYFVAKEKGFYKNEGLYVDIEEGGYGKNCMTTVKHGAEEFGISKWVTFANENDLISIAQIIKDSGLVLVSKKSKGITKPDDLIGRKVGLWFVGNEYPLYALMDKAGISEDKVNIVRQNWDMKQFVNDEIDVASAMTFNELISLYDKEKYSKDDINIIDFNDYGVEFPGESIFTSKEYYKAHPDICRKFVSASIKGWEYVIDHPDEAAEIVMRYDKENRLNLEHEKKQVREIIKLIEKDKYKIGIHDKEKFERIADLYSKYGIIKDCRNSQDMYTNEFIQ